MPHSKAEYGPLWRDLYRFLSVKYRINDDSMRAIVTDVFRYIDAEVMRNGEFFSIPGFGTFRRMEAGNGWDPNTPAEWMKLDRTTRKFQGTLFTQEEDPEDAGPREG